MKKIPVTITRVYISESEKLLSPILKLLKNDVKIRGFTVFRAIEGLSASAHSAMLVDLSLDLPLVVEFFDDDENKISSALEKIGALVKPEHILIWKAETII